jgi:hypothetical protein
MSVDGPVAVTGAQRVEVDGKQRRVTVEAEQDRL